MLSNTEVQLLDPTNGKTVASIMTDANGDFVFVGVKPGHYRLYAKAQVWQGIQWPVRFSKTNSSSCAKPLHVVLGPRGGMDCESWVTKKNVENELKKSSRAACRQ
jgi:protocatechuate 3,4-dioxygenase beta subunit